MGIFKYWKIVLSIFVLAAIFVYFLWYSIEYLNPANIIGTVLVAGIIVYFIVTANSLKKGR